MIEVLPDPGELARAVADHFVARAAESIAASGRFTVALAGGSTPRATYLLLATDAFARRVDWARVQVLWGDERCVPPSDPQSNYRMAREALLDRIPIPPSNIHRIRGEDDPAASAAAYERLLRDVVGEDGRLDLILLGMGSDGHTASLFPGQAALDEKERWVVAHYVADAAMWRITLTPVVINMAREASFVVSGAAKAERLRDVIKGPFAPERLPAQLVDPTPGRLTWLVDAAAASRLRMTETAHMVRNVDPRAGQLPDPSMLANIPKLMTAYYTKQPDPSVAGAARRIRHVGPSRLGARQRVQRGAHPRDHPGDLRIPASSRRSTGRSSSASTPTRSPSRRSRARSRCSPRTASTVMLDDARRIHADAGRFARDPHVQPRPHDRTRRRRSSSRRRTTRRRTAASSTIRRTAARPTRDVTGVDPGARQRAPRRRPCSGVQRMPLRAGAARVHDAPARLHRRLHRRSGATSIDFDVHPRRGAAARRRSAGRRRRRTTGGRSPSGTGSTLTVVSEEVDPTFRFMTARLGRQDPHGPLVPVRDAATDRAARTASTLRGRATPTTTATASSRAAPGCCNPNHYLAVAIDYLFAHRPAWRADAGVGKTVVSSSMIDRVTAQARPPARRGAGRLQVVRRRTARRLARLRRRGKRRRVVPSPRRHGVDHGQGWHHPRAAGRGDDGAPRAAIPASCIAS